MNPNLINILKANVEALPAKDLAFGYSLVGQHAKKGQLSEKQWHWVGVLVDKLTNPTQAAAPQKVEVGDIAGVVALFAKAKTHLQYPKIALKTDVVGDFELSLAGETSKAPGSINVTKKASFGTIWLGRVTQEGVFQPSTKLEPYKKDSLASVLCALAKAPAKVAASYGKLTSKCCFCKKTLTDPQSIAVGYGEICAGHFGLPWGLTAQMAA